MIAEPFMRDWIGQDATRVAVGTKQMRPIWVGQVGLSVSFGIQFSPSALQNVAYRVIIAGAESSYETYPCVTAWASCFGALGTNFRKSRYRDVSGTQ